MTTYSLSDSMLTFIGSGTMAGAIIHALLEAGEVSPHHIVASDPVVERLEELKTCYDVQVTSDNVAAVGESA